MKQVTLLVIMSTLLVGSVAIFFIWPAESNEPTHENIDSLVPEPELLMIGRVLVKMKMKCSFQEEALMNQSSHRNLIIYYYKKEFPRKITIMDMISFRVSLSRPVILKIE